MSMELINKLRAEGLVPIKAAAKAANLGVNYITLYRWIKRGCRRDGRVVRLEAVQVGGQLMTTEAAVLRFLHVPVPEGDETPAVRTPIQRQKAQSAAARELDVAGI